MTNANYAKYLKLLGKLAYAWGNAGGQVSELNEELFRAVEQAAQSGQDDAGLPELLVMSANANRWNTIIAAGPGPLQSLMLQIATALLQLPSFTGAIITTDGLAALTSKTNVTVILQAWAAEMGDDSKTLTTASSTGLVAFLNAVAGTTVSFPQSGSPTYADGTYAVLSIV